MQKRLAQILGVSVAVLVIAGLPLEHGHFLGLFNVNIALDLLRIPLAGALLYAGFGNAASTTVRSVLGATGILYLGLAILGILNARLWGVLPDGLTGFDILFHLGIGLLATWAAYSAREESPARM